MTSRVFRLLTSLCLSLACSFQGAFGQLDTEFWFVAPEVWDGHGDDPILLRFSTLGDAAQITVEQPANPAFPIQTLNIPANGTQTLDLTTWLGDIGKQTVQHGFGERPSHHFGRTRDCLL